MSVAAFLATKDTEPDKIYETKIAPKLFFITSFISFILMIIGLIIIASSSKAQNFLIGSPSMTAKYNYTTSQIYHAGVNNDV